MEIPTGKNIFYRPLLKNQEEVCPSPAISKQYIETLSQYSNSKNAMQETASVSAKPEINMNTNNEFSTSISSLIQLLSSQGIDQPYNLQEIVQHSFSSLPSFSLLQSPFITNLPSPFLGAPQTQTSNLNSDFSNLLSSSILGSSIASPAVFNSHAISELLRRGQPFSGKSDPQNPESLEKIMKIEEDSDLPVKTISLSSGLTMNAVNRNPGTNTSTTSEKGLKFNSVLSKGDKQKRSLEDIVEEEPYKNKSDIIVDETKLHDDTLFKNFHLYNMIQPTSLLINTPSNTLNQQMNSMSLTANLFTNISGKINTVL